MSQTLLNLPVTRSTAARRIIVRRHERTNAHHWCMLSRDPDSNLWKSRPYSVTPHLSEESANRFVRPNKSRDSPHDGFDVTW